MRDLKDRIEKLIEVTGWNSSKIADEAKVSKSAVTHWRNGSTVEIKSETASNLAKNSGFTVQWLIDGRGPMTPEASNVSQANPARGTVPVISSVRAGTWGEINDHVPDGDETFSVREAKVGPNAFALRVDGDSMTWDGLPNFPEGAMLIVDPDRAPKAGDYVIAKNTDKQAALFKKLVTDGYAWQLKSLNRDFKPINIEDPCIEVIGVVVEYWAGGKL